MSSMVSGAEANDSLDVAGHAGKEEEETANLEKVWQISSRMEANTRQPQVMRRWNKLTRKQQSTGDHHAVVVVEGVAATEEGTATKREATQVAEAEEEEEEEGGEEIEGPDHTVVPGNISPSHSSPSQVPPTQCPLLPNDITCATKFSQALGNNRSIYIKTYGINLKGTTWSCLGGGGLELERGPGLFTSSKVGIW